MKFVFSSLTGAAAIIHADVVDTIYEAALVPDRWADVLAELAVSAGGDGGMLFAIREDAQVGIATDAALPILDAVRSGQWISRDSRMRLLLSLPQAAFHSDGEHFTDEQMAEDPLYTELVWPLGLGYTAGTAVSVPNGDSLVISVERKRLRGRFSRHDIDGLTRLRPHLARSAMIAARFNLERIRSANWAFDTLGIPAAALTSSGFVINCNSSMENSSHVEIGAGNKIRFTNPQAQRSFEEVSNVSALRINQGSSIPLPGKGDLSPAVLHVLPVRGTARDLFSHCSYFVAITPVVLERLPSQSLIRGLFDLSNAEARVAQLIAVGKRVDTIAAEHAVSRETIRHHLKSIFLKTGYRRQVELAIALRNITSI